MVEVETALWILILLLFVLSIVGLILPILPGMLFLWGGFLLYQFTLGDPGLPASFWILTTVFTLLMFGADFYMNVFFVNRFGGSVWSQWASLLGLILGFFIYPPFGILLLPLLFIFMIESYLQGSYRKGIRVSLATLASIISSSVVKGVLQILLIVIFFLYIVL